MKDAAYVMLAKQVMEYILMHGDDLWFTKFFWKDCEPLDGDVIEYRKFAQAHKLASDGNDRVWISEELDASSSIVGAWLSFTKMPKLAHYLMAHLELGAPVEFKRWLTLRCSHGYAIPKGPWIQVPMRINSWKDFESTTEQLKPIANATLQRDFKVGFPLGMILGDASKSKPGNGHRHINLTMSMEYETNVLLGEFTCQAAAAFGLNMHRIADLARPPSKPNGFYCGFQNRLL